MTEEELKEAADPTKHVSLIIHDNMKDVGFWPLSIEITKDSYKLYGLWYNGLYKKTVLRTDKNIPIKESITIKKKDLPSWKIKSLTHLWALSPVQD